MSVDLLLRALRKLSKGYHKGGGVGGACCSTTNRMAKRHAAKLRRTKRLADKIHKKIVERFETTKVLRVSSPSATVRCCNMNWVTSIGSQFKCPLCGEEKLLLGIVK